MTGPQTGIFLAGCWFRLQTTGYAYWNAVPIGGGWLLEQLPHGLAGGLSCHPAADPFAYLVLFEGVIVPISLARG